MNCIPLGSSVHGDSLGKNAGVGCRVLLQRIFPTQGSNQDLLHYKWILYQLSLLGSPRILEWVAYPFSRWPSPPRNQTGVSCIADGFFFLNFTILYWFCHISTCIRYGCTCVPHPEPPSHSPPRTIPLGHPSAPAQSFLYPASNLDWRFISYMIYMFQCHSPKSSHPLPLPLNT